MSFYTVLSEYYDEIFPLNNKSIDFIKDRINADGTIIDVAAGTGNHAIALAKEGFKVIATDIDENMVNIIKEKAITAAVPVEGLKMPMEKISTLNTKGLDAVLCLGNSLVHLHDLSSVKAFLKDVYDQLSAEGKLIVQIVNYDRILSEGVTSLPKIEKKHVSFFRTYKHIRGKIIFNGELQVNNGNNLSIYNNEIELLPITSEDLRQILSEIGFKSIKLFGSFAESPFTKDSLPLIIEAKK